MLSLKRSAVFVLLRPRRPAAVTGFVVAVIVDTVKREAGRFLAHVSEKVFKAVTPAVAHFDAAPAVVFKLLNFRIIAARFHLRPRAVCGAPAAGCVAVGEISLAGYIAQQTPARSRISAAQVTGADGNLDTACATAAPVNYADARRASVTMRNTENGQSIKLPTCDVIQFGHRAAPTVRGSSGGQTLPGLTVAHSLQPR